ncbi:MAG: hypothetical protein NTW05_25620 [Pseudonocardiales bacterium]|nr:hypothetical protein [Pseudonocardiales bacterium]
MGIRARVVVLTVIVVTALAACTTTPPPEPATARVSAPEQAVTVLGTDDPVALAVATSAALFATAPAAVLAAPEDTAAAAAVAQGVPLLLVADGADTAGVGAELDRLGVTGVLPVGDAARDRVPGGREVLDALPPLTPQAPRPDVLVLTTDPGSAAAATARASGARVEAVTDPDPRVAPPPQAPTTVALGTAFGAPDVLAARLAVAATGVQLPGGGQVVFPGRRMVALYGHPGVPALGVLGEQDVAASVARAQALAAEYQPFSAEPVVPAFELISTIADSGPGPDGDYSAEATVEFLRPWVDAAGAAGLYVLLDLQPGRTDFRTQAERYAELLREPHVGLALDPEWRLGPDQRPLQQIGSVGVDEVNAVVTWLADLTREAALPQKVLMLHQFRLAMITDRERLDTSRDELAVVIHADGFGPPGEKLATWDAMHQGAPAGITWGWKNFYDEDSPTFTPEQTLSVGPEPPVIVSYQ